MSSTNPPTTRLRKPRGQGPSRRGEILAAATRIFRSEGVAHATMRRIAATVGVSPTALYVYFPDKDAILQAIAEATFADLLATIEASLLQSAAPATGEASATLRCFRASLHAYVGFGLSQPDAYRVTFMNKCRPIQAADHSFALLRNNIEVLMAAGLFRPGSPDTVAEAVWACLHGLTILLIDQAEHLDTPRATLIEQVIELVMSGAAR